MASDPLAPLADGASATAAGENEAGLSMRTKSGRFSLAAMAAEAVAGATSKDIAAEHGRTDSADRSDKHGNVPQDILLRSFGPHILGGSHSSNTNRKTPKTKKRAYIGVPVSAVLKCQGAEDNVDFWDYYKQDALLFDEATKVEGHCFTCPPACDNMIQMYGTGLATERHAFYRRRKCIRTTDSQHSALVRDEDAGMESMLCAKGIAYETKDTQQVQCDTGDLVYACGDGTVHYQSLRYPAMWRRSAVWRQQRRRMLNAHLKGVLYSGETMPDPNEERPCDVRLKEFFGLEHRAMLNAPAVRDTLTSIVSHTLQFRVERLCDFWPSVDKLRTVGGKKVKSVQAYWELSLLPKDAKMEHSSFSQKTTERLLYNPPALAGQHHVITSGTGESGKAFSAPLRALSAIQKRFSDVCALGVVFVVVAGCRFSFGWRGLQMGRDSLFRPIR